MHPYPHGRCRRTTRDAPTSVFRSSGRPTSIARQFPRIYPLAHGGPMAPSAVQHSRLRPRCARSTRPRRPRHRSTRWPMSIRLPTWHAAIHRLISVPMAGNRRTRTTLLEQAVPRCLRHITRPHLAEQALPKASAFASPSQPTRSSPPRSPIPARKRHPRHCRRSPTVAATMAMAMAQILATGHGPRPTAATTASTSRTARRRPRAEAAWHTF